MKSEELKIVVYAQFMKEENLQPRFLFVTD